MISGLCGFAERIRHHGGDVGAAELIDAARAFTFIDLADRKAIEGALRLTISWASLQPKAFRNSSTPGLQPTVSGRGRRG